MKIYQLPKNSYRTTTIKLKFHFYASNCICFMILERNIQKILAISIMKIDKIPSIFGTIVFKNPHNTLSENFQTQIFLSLKELILVVNFRHVNCTPLFPSS